MASVENVVPTTTLGVSKPIDNTQDVVVNLMDNLSIKKDPIALTGPLVWSGDDFPSVQSYALQLSKEEVAEVDSALAHFKTLGLNGDEVGRDNFPLPTLGRRLQTCTEALHLGRGFSVVRGLDGSNYSVEDSVVVFLGIASYIAEKRGLQDRKGNMLSHITDSKQWTVPANRRHGIHSNGALPFHSDMGCDILSLQVRHSAPEGGFTYLSSAWTVFNDLLDREPEVITTLMTPNWPVQISGRKASYYLAPVFTFHDGKLLASCDPHRLGPHPSMTNSKIPALTDAQKHALEAVSKSAYRSEVQLRLQAGDLLFFNNLALMHRRDAYKDDETSSRHLVRLWLRSQTFGWAIPDSLYKPWKAAYGANRRITSRIYPVDPVAEYDVPKYTTSSAAFMIEDSDESDSDEE